MIDLNELKPILEGLLEGREDAADVIEQVTGLDRVVDVDQSKIDEVNASWNERFKKAFFGEKADDLKDEIPTVEEVETAGEEVKDQEDLNYDDLFTKVEEKKEEE